MLRAVLLVPILALLLMGGVTPEHAVEAASDGKVVTVPVAHRVVRASRGHGEVPEEEATSRFTPEGVNRRKKPRAGLPRRGS